MTAHKDSEPRTGLAFLSDQSNTQENMLDEATISLDAESDLVMQDVIREESSSCMIVVIARRVSFQLEIFLYLTLISFPWLETIK